MSIGIIGGADGPTSILITGNNRYGVISAVIACAIAAVIIVWKIMHKRNSK